MIKLKKISNYLPAIGAALIICLMLILSGCLETKQIKESNINWQYAIPWNPKKIQIVDDMVFVQTDYNFHILDANNGKLRWRFGEGARFIEAAQWDKKSVYLAAYDDKAQLTNLVVSIDIQTGRDNWAISTKEEIEAMVSDSKALYITSISDTFYRVEKATGKISKWNGKLATTGLQSQKKVYRGKIYRSKKDFYKSKFKRLAKSLSFLNAAKGVIYVAKQSYPYGTSARSIIYAIDEKSGRKKWSFKFPTANGPDGAKVMPTVVSDKLILLVLWELGDEGYGNTYIYAIKQ